MSGKSHFSAKWIPKNARDELLAQTALTSADRALLRRLASPDIKPDVWDKLPRSARGSEGLIVAWTCHATALASGWRPPRPIDLAGLAESIARYPPILSTEDALGRSQLLLEAMNATGADARERWQLWPGNSDVTFEAALSFVEHVREFYHRLDAEHKELWAAIDFPYPRKARGRNVRRDIVARILSARFQKNFGQPCDEVVAALVAVVYPDDAPSAEAIRGLRRFAPAG